MSAELQTWVANLIMAKVPFVPHGRSRAGLDCYGVPYLAYLELKNTLLPSHTDEYLPKDIRNFEHLRKIIADDLPNWEEKKKGEAFDLILLRLRGRPIHIGLVTRPGFMVHIEEDIEVCEERYDGTYWKDRIVGIYRPRSL